MAYPWHREPNPRVLAGHADFDCRFTELVDLARRGRWDDVAEEWPTFAEDLEAHLEFEEREMFGPYASERSANRSQVRRLEAEHKAIRDGIALLSWEIEAGEVSADAIGDFARDLNAHSLREEATIYAWLEHRRRPASDA